MKHPIVFLGQDNKTQLILACIFFIFRVFMKKEIKLSLQGSNYC